MDSKSITKVFGGIIAIAVAFLIFPIILDSSSDIRVEDVSQQFVNVTTGVGELTADVTLTDALYKDNTYYVDSVASNNVTDTPVAGSYAAASQNLTVTGLSANTTRTLTVDYKKDALTNYAGVSSLITVAPLIIFILLLFGGGFSAYWGFKGIKK